MTVITDAARAAWTARQFERMESVEHRASGAAITRCEKYRPLLWRRWGPGGDLVFCMLNPSKADAAVNDPTVTKCIGFAQRLGYGGIIVVNLWAYRATRPQDLAHEGWPHNPLNDHVLAAAFDSRDVICAWGANARGHARVDEVLTVMRGLALSTSALRLLADGTPEHPLYIPYDCADNLVPM